MIYRITYIKEILLVTKGKGRKKDSYRKSKEILTMDLESLSEEQTELKEDHKMPHIIAEFKAAKLWKMFRKMTIEGFALTEEPRLELQVGTHWFKIINKIIIV